MDPRERREDETMAEWGARLSSMGEDVAFGPQGVGGFKYSRPSPLPVLPIGSDYTDEQLRTPIRELREQNVVPIRPFQKVSQVVPAGLNMRVPGQSGFISEVTPYTETPAYTGYKGLSQDYGDFSSVMGMLPDMAGDQPVYDPAVVTDMPSRTVVDPRSYSTNMPDVSQTLPADTQLRMLDSRQPRTWGPVPSEGIVPIGGIPSGRFDTAQRALSTGLPDPAYPSMQADYSQTTPGIRTGMPVAMDAGGAVGGGWADPPSLYPNQIGITAPAVERLPLSIENLAGEDYQSPLSSSDISVQATQAAADARAADYMAAAAGTQDMMTAGGVVGGGVSDFIKDWAGKVDDARTIVTPAGPVTVGADSRGATFTLDVPASRRTGPTVDAPPPDLIKAQEQVDIQAMLARSAQRLQDEQAEQARQAQVAQVTADAQAQAQQAQLAYAAMKSQLMQGRDRGEPSAREVQRAMERATQVDTFGGYGRQEGGGFDPQGGATGSSGMGGWT